MSILRKVLIPSFLLLYSCSGPEQSEQERIQRQNAKGEFIHRKHTEKVYPIAPPQKRPQEKYPWEED